MIGGVPLTPGMLAPASLSRPEAGNSPAALRQVAQEFEALLLEMVIRQMRTAAQALAGERQDLARDIYSSWFDREVAAAVSRGGGVGLAGLFYQHLVRHYGR